MTWCKIIDQKMKLFPLDCFLTTEEISNNPSTKCQIRGFFYSTKNDEFNNNNKKKKKL